jgi:hypothetical protein
MYTWTLTDLMTGIFLTYEIFPFNIFSFGQFVRTPFVIFCILISLTFSKGIKKNIIILTSILLLLLSFKIIYYESGFTYLQNLLKYYSFIFILPSILIVIGKDKIELIKIVKILNVNTAIILINLVLPFLGIGAGKYGTSEDGVNIGSVGFFYAGNELNTSLLLIYASYYHIFRFNTRTFYKLFFIFLFFTFLTLSKSIIGGFLIISFLAWKIYHRGGLFIPLVLLVFLISLLLNYLEKIYYLNLYFDSFSYFYEKSDTFIEFISSGRNLRLDAFNITEFFSRMDYVIWGTFLPGVPNFTFEMDYFEILFYHGTIGLVLMIFYWILVKDYLNFYNDNSIKRFYFLFFIFFNFLAFFVGHTLSSQMSLIYLIIFLLSKDLTFTSSAKTSKL